MNSSVGWFERARDYISINQHEPSKIQPQKVYPQWLCHADARQSHSLTQITSPDFNEKNLTVAFP